MKYWFFVMLIMAVATRANAQTTGGTKPTTVQKKNQVNKQEKKRVQRGTGQYYGNKDTTPGSPMGTGGAGGDMSGSPAGSAIETDDQTSKATTDSGNTNNEANAANMRDTTMKGPAIKKAGTTKKGRRGTL